MVAGNGMIAQRFNAYLPDDRFLVFASGVSNSKTTDRQQYEREQTLLEKTIKENPDKTFVYFGTCSIHDPIEQGSHYVAHKQHMENIVRSSCARYNILRVSNVVGRSANGNTIFNFLAHNIIEGIPFQLWLHATRNLIDLDDLYRIADHILQNGLFQNSIVNIANPQSYLVPDIVAAIERFYGLKGQYTALDKGTSFRIETTDITQVINALQIHFDEHYLDTLIQKTLGKP